MSIPVTDPQVYADFAGLDALKRGARSNDPAALRAVAKQFESLFARIMIKSMRDAVGKDPIFGSDQEQTYQEMFDDQLSVEITRGKGLGLADMLVRQLQRMSDSATGAGTGGANAAGTSVGGVSATGATAPGVRAPSTSATTAHAPALGAGTASAASPGAVLPPATSAEKASFVRSLWPHAQQAAQALGVDPRALVAQAALETSWGRNIPGSAAGSSHNLFGIKATGGWSGPSVDAATQEFSGGAFLPASARFRAYGSPGQSVQDYVAVLSSPRYAAARNTGGNVEAFASALQQAGYATDPDYARKLSAIARQLAPPALLADARPASAPGALKFSGGLPMTGRADSPGEST